jgi:hypothetical protein
MAPFSIADVVPKSCASRAMDGFAESVMVEEDERSSIFQCLDVRLASLASKSRIENIERVKSPPNHSLDWTPSINKT